MCPRAKEMKGRAERGPHAPLPTWGVGFWAQLGAGVGFLLCDTWPSSCVPTQDSQSPPTPGSCSGPQHPEPSSPRPSMSASSKHSQAGQRAELSWGPQSRGCLWASHQGQSTLQPRESSPSPERARIPSQRREAGPGQAGRRMAGAAGQGAPSEGQGQDGQDEGRGSP